MARAFSSSPQTNQPTNQTKKAGPNQKDIWRARGWSQILHCGNEKGWWEEGMTTTTVVCFRASPPLHQLWGIVKKACCSATIRLPSLAWEVSQICRLAASCCCSCGLFSNTHTAVSTSKSHIFFSKSCLLAREVILFFPEVWLTDCSCCLLLLLVMANWIGCQQLLYIVLSKIHELNISSH